MIAAEMIANKFQKILGKQYAVHVNAAFNADFTSTVQNPYGGWMRDVNWQAFDQYADTIVAVVSTQPIQLYNTPYTFIQDSYSVQFWVPVDFVKRNAFGELLEPPKFDFYGDIARLSAELAGKTTLDNGNTALDAFFTVSEPALANNGIDNSGAYKRVVMQISGSVTISDKNVRTGSDIRISFEVDGVEAFIENAFDVGIGANTESNAILEDGDAKVKQDVAQSQQGVTFKVDDYQDGNSAMVLIEAKALENTGVLTTGAIGDSRMKVLVRVYKKDVLRNSFWGMLSASVSYPSRSGVGVYDVAVSNDGREA